jgi:hypothetical protein
MEDKLCRLVFTGEESDDHLYIIINVMQRNV